MKLQKDPDDGSWSIITKKATMNFSFYQWWSDWALPLHVEIDSWGGDYFDIRLHILIFSFSFVRISHEYGTKLDKMFEKGGS